MDNVRATRLVSIVLLLQAKGRLTADQLATELEVSARTIYRDIDALHEAGIPVYGDAGHRGGYQLVDGYRTRLTGLTRDEAMALPLAGLPGPASELGLGALLAAAQLKVRAALPAELGEQAGRVQARFYLDAPGWYARPDETPFLPAVADAVWRGQILQVRYRRWKAPTEVDRRLEPYGLVLKAGRWYLVAAPGPRTYRVDQILDLTPVDEHFTIPSTFDLAGYWQAATADFLGRLRTTEAVVRLSPAAAGQLAVPTDEAGPPDDEGWIQATVPIESVELACRNFLALGPGIEVIAPPDLRARMASSAHAIAALYGATAPVPAGRVPHPPGQNRAGATPVRH